MQFINSFAAMFFIAFAQPFLGNVNGFRHCESSCYKQIQVTLDVLFFSKLTTGSALALILPYLNKKIKEDEEFSEVLDPDEISFVERQFVLESITLTTALSTILLTTASNLHISLCLCRPHPYLL